MLFFLDSALWTFVGNFVGNFVENVVASWSVSQQVSDKVFGKSPESDATRETACKFINA